MKRKINVSLSSICMVAALMIFAGCKKDSNNTNACKVTKYIKNNGSGNVSGYYVYDNSGRVVKDSSTTGMISYSYIGNTINSSRGDLIQINGSGFPTSVKEYNSGTITFTYNSDGTLSKIEDPGNYSYIDSIQYLNGNIVSMIEHINFGSVYNRYEYNFTYYTDKMYNTPFDPTAKFTGYYGYIGENGVQIFSKNLLKSDFGWDYTYQFDSDGRVTYMKVTSGGGTTVREAWYEYTCN